MSWWCAILLAAPVARAADETPGLSVGARLSGESLQDPNLVALYTPEGLGGELTASVPLPKNLRLRFAIGYHRRAGVLFDDLDGNVGDKASWFMYVPISAPVFYDLHAGSVALGIGAGPTYVVWAEPPQHYEDTRQSGGKWGVDLELEARIATGMVAPSLHAPDEGPRRMDVVISAGYRHAFRHVFAWADPTGLSLSAVRVGAGVELVY